LAIYDICLGNVSVPDRSSFDGSRIIDLGRKTQWHCNSGGDGIGIITNFTTTIPLGKSKKKTC